MAGEKSIKKYFFSSAKLSILQYVNKGTRTSIFHFMLYPLIMESGEIACLHRLLVL